jgi:hypothetical protein
MSKHTRFIPTGMAAVATAAALLCIALSVTTPARAQGRGSNPPWYPSLMASEAYDSGRTRLFEQAHFTGSFNRPNEVDVLTTPRRDVYLTPYNVVYKNAHSMFVYGGGFGDQGGMGAFVAKVDSTTLRRIWFKQLIHIDTRLSHSAWDYPGVVGMLDDGMLYVIYGAQLTKLDPRDGRIVRTLKLPTDEANDWPDRDTAYNGFVALPDGTIIAKTVYRQIGCTAQGFDAFLKLPEYPDCEHPEEVPHSVLVAIDPERMRVLDRIEIPAFTVGRVTSTSFQGQNYIYVPGPKNVYRYIWKHGRFTEDTQWGPVQYNDDVSGQTPASAVVVMNDWIMFTTNGAKISEPCENELKGPCQSPWLTVWAINQADSSIRHRLQPFENMQPPPSSDYPLSFCPSAPTVDPLRKRIFVFDAGPGKMAAVDLDPDGLHRAWIVDQRTTEFQALIGSPNRRVVVSTEIPPGQPLGTNSSNFVVWRDSESGQELARVHLPPVLSGTMVQPGYDGHMYYLGDSDIKKLTVRPAR